MNFFSICLMLFLLGVAKVKSAEIPEEIKHLVAGVREKCHRETGVDIDHVEKTKDGYFHPSEVLGCYFSCIFNHFELLDHDGHFDFEKAFAKLSMVESMREHGEEVLTKCRGTTGANPCDSALNIVQCFHKANPDKYFVI